MLKQFSVKCKDLFLKRLFRAKSTGIYEYIKATGPLTVAQYMRECLSNPLTGYYMRQTVFGSDGDFVTSPEISQVFGELIGVWMMADWMLQDKPCPCNLIELGPGTGSMMADILRVLEQLKEMLPAVSIHLVETSPAMRARQRTLLTKDITTDGVDKIKLPNGITVNWYSSLSQVPHGYGYYLAHEFFDALPIHQFTCIGDGEWREILVDIDKLERKLCFVKASLPTPASLSYSSLLGDGATESEVCPDGLVIMEEISRRVKQYGGNSLIADYGEEQINGFTFRGYRRQREVDVLSSPGEVDLTADVNFGHLKQIIAAHGCVSHGPITQNEFLHKMGIRQRLDVLLNRADPDVTSSLIRSYEWLTSAEKMGKRFKFIALTNTLQHIPTPFSYI